MKNSVFFYLNFSWVYFYGFLLSFISGIGLASFVSISRVVWIFLLNTSIIALSIVLILFFLFLSPYYVSSLKRQIFIKTVKISLLFSLLCIGFVGGVFHFSSFWHEEGVLAPLRDTGQEMTFVGTVSEEPEIKEKSTNYTLTLLPFEEKALVSLPSSASFSYGETLRLSGKLITPKTFDGFNYKNYLKKEDIYSVMYYPRSVKSLRKTPSSPSRKIYGNLLSFKQKLKESTLTIFPYKEGTLLNAMILGEKTALSENMKTGFSKSGIRHITAISGMHITIIMAVLIFISVYVFNKGAREVTFFLIGLIIFYIIFIGSPSSALRAGIMASVLLIAGRASRQYHALFALILAASVMLVINPLVLRYDVGFQLSFVAVIGILFITPLWNALFTRLFSPENKVLIFFQNIVALTLSAQIATLPLVAYHFGIISLVAPLANVVVVPLLPLIIVAGGITILLGVLSSPLAFIISVPTLLLLSFVIFVSDFLVSLPFSFITTPSFSPFVIIIAYSFICILVLILRRVYLSKNTLFFFTHSSTNLSSTTPS